MNDVENILAERGSRYGKFVGIAQITRDLKLVIQDHLEERDKHLPPDMHEALDMICHKIARVINGDPNYADTWIDIAGYAKLVSDRLQNLGEHAAN